jgi:predicted Zn-dependent protease
MTQVGSVTREQVAAEQVKQQQLALQAQLARERRLDDVAAPLLRAATPLCGGAVAYRAGITAANLPALPPEYATAAFALGFTDTVQVTSVAQSSPAERAGLRPGDRVLAVNGQPLPTGRGASEELVNQLSRADARVALTVRSDRTVHTVYVDREPACDYSTIVVTGDALNAFSDGKRIYVYSRMLEFASNDDELATVVSHEIAHNAMHHIDAKKSNALVGALLGAVLDVASLRAGVNTGGAYSRQFAELGSMVFSQDFEREADYVGLHILAASGRSLDASANFWRRMAQEHPSSISFATTHPTTAERFVRLDQERTEIASKLAAGEPLRLAMKDGSQGPVLSIAPGTSRPTAVVASSRSTTDGAPPRAPESPPQSAGGHAAQQSAFVGRTEAEPSARPPATKERPAAQPRSRGRVPESSDSMAVAVVGAPASDSARLAAVKVLEDGKIYLARHEWDKAEEQFRKAVLLDGSVALYHAALGSVELVLEKWAEAQAEYTAALMIDASNEEYRQRLIDAQHHRGGA